MILLREGKMHGFEIRIGPYGPTRLTGNRPLERFFYF